ncbi:SPASM domain-containing protein [Halobacteriovorax marinus]|uniref:SPASM domain-containing protein n=1 Tax=Halobacteriovorax marinus TaxID=97084 RepID=UPI003A933A43
MKLGKRVLQRKKSTHKVLNDFERMNLDKNNFCIVPFTNIILEPNGSVGMCRQKGTEFSIGNLKKNTLNDIWNGPIAKKWRREFLNGQSEMCRSDIDFKNCNLCGSNNLLLEEAQLEEIQNTPILKLTANFNGFCNLKCQMCDVWKLPNGYYTEENFWKDARESLFPFLREIDMLSGEPFLQKDTFKLIDEVSRLNDSCVWNITTNAHWALSEEIKSHLDKINFRNMILSVDSLVPEVYGKIRFPGKLSRVLKTIEDILVYDKQRVTKGLSSLNLNMNFLVQKDNWMEVEEVVKYCGERDIIPFITFCENPSEHSVLTFSEEKRKEILEFYFSLSSEVQSLLMRVIKPIIFSIQPIDRIDYLLRLQKTLVRN